MPIKLIGKKRGMTQIFDEKGYVIPCTVILALPNKVVQIKKKEKDGYNAIQLGAFFDIKEKNVKKPILMNFNKKKISPCRCLKESKMENIEGYEIGQEIDVTQFKKGDFIDVIGKSKGKGFQGVMKLHGFKGGPASHGSKFHRLAGSTGMRSTPGRCFSGGKRASRMGFDKVTVQRLKVLLVDKEKNVIVVKGSIPGSNGSTVYITKSKKEKKSGNS